MNVEEFEATKHSLECDVCKRVGLTTFRNPNNNGVRPHCPNCGSTKPLSDVMWLKQNGNRKPTPRPTGDPTTSEVWSACGDTCAFCGISRDECELLGIGITKQHIVPFCSGGADSYLIPFCSRCQQASLAALQVTLAFRRYIDKTRGDEGATD